MISKFLRDERATAAIEFALVGPVVVFALFSMISAFVAERAVMKAAVTAQSVADLTAQAATVTTSTLADYCLAGKLIMTPDNQTGTTAGSHLAISYVSVVYKSSASPHIFIPGPTSVWNLGWTNNPAGVAINAGTTNAPSYSDNCAAITTSGSGSSTTVNYTDPGMFTEGGGFGSGGDPSTNTVLSQLLTTDGQQVIVARATYTFDNPFALFTSTRILILNSIASTTTFASPLSITQYGYAIPAKGTVQCLNSNNSCAPGC